MPLLNYWPVRQEINRCIKTQAESASDAVLLAVHQPIALLKRIEGSKTETKVTEKDLLDAFLTDDLPEGTLVMPITGPSGAGKSHLIRWLAAELGRDPRAKKMHVIRIPKSASLRSVVEIILEPLKGDPEFFDVIKSLDTAIAQVKPDEAAVSFSGALEISLNRLYDQLLAKLKNNPSPVDDKETKLRARHAKGLPGFFNDASIREHITTNVLGPIIDRAINGGEVSEIPDEEFLPQFTSDDLKIPLALERKLGEASRNVQVYYQTILNAGDGEGRTLASDVLNQVIDEAIQQVFQIAQATGGLTLESIILKVREILFRQNRELVLLIEDFAALSGIQQVLLSVCIQEAERDGIKVRSPMRTAVALTDGYLVERDTIATRAKQEWVIQPLVGHEDVIGRTVEMIGSYLNAARWGEESLISQYLQYAPGKTDSLTNWVDIYSCENLSPQDSDVLKIFGLTERNIPLFPYNYEAIEGLVKRHLRIGGEIRFNPRRVINHIMREVLLSGRDDFVKGDFPVPGFEGTSASAEVKGQLAESNLSESEKRRIEAILAYWGGDPTEISEVADLPDELFSAFGLKRPNNFGEASDKPYKPGPKVVVKPAGEKENPETNLRPSNTPQVENWRKLLRDWSEGTELSFREANKLRTILTKNILKAIPWNQLRISKTEVKFRITIPNARGNISGGINISVADHHSDPDGELQRTLLGAYRLEESGGELNYDGADEDSARFANLIQRLVDDLLIQIESERTEEVQSISWVLYRQALILGIAERKRMTARDAVVHSIRNTKSLNEVEDSSAYGDDSGWNELRIESAQRRASLQSKLFNRIGCYQGDGKQLQAIDPTLITFTDQPEPANFFDSNEKDHFRQLKPIFLNRRVKLLYGKIKKLADKLQESLGSDYDKQGLLSNFSNLLDVLDSIGVWPATGLSPKRLKTHLDNFRTYDLKRQLEVIQPILEQDGHDIDLTKDDSLKRLGSFNISILEATHSQLQNMENFVTEVEREIDLKEKELKSITPENDAESLSRRLDEMDRDLKSLLVGRGV